MGGRGSRSGGGGAVGGGGGGGAVITPNANGGVTITPPPNANAQQLTGAGSGVSDVNSHTTYFTPADMATVSNMVTDGYRVSPRTGAMCPVGYYQTGDYANINGDLRDLANGRISKLPPQTQKVVDAMDRNMRPLNQSMESTRWTDLNAISDNLGMRGASKQQIINRLKNGDIVGTKNDYTSSSWDDSANAVAGQAGRYVMVKMHYKQGAMVQFSPTRKEGEVVGARGKQQRFSNARAQRVLAKNQRYGDRWVDALVIDCYVDN